MLGMHAKKPKGNFLVFQFSILYIILFAPPEVIHSCGAFGLLVDSFLSLFFFFLICNFGHGLFLGRKGS